MTLTFFLMKSIPGDPFIQEQEIPKEILTSLYKHYGLDQPLYVQYLKYLKGFFTFDLGPSYIYQGRTVNQIINDGFFVSMTIGLQALVISVFFGITFGSLAALKKNRWPDTLSILIAIIGISLPNFLLATLLQYFFAIKLKLLPVARWGSFAHTILPSIALAAMPLAFIARLTRNNMIEVLEQDYIKTAYAKGLNHIQVIVGHGLRNALIPVISYLGPITTYVLTGSFVIEKIFGIPGLGQWLIHSISNRDYTVIMGLTVFFSILLMSIVLLTDIIIAFVDPRIKILNDKSYP
jgi:oligopeptide transport system permease protein